MKIKNITSASGNPVKLSCLAAPLSTAGILLVAFGIFLAMIFYNGANKEQYSVMNHFISELGWLKRSKMAWIFNTSIAAGSIFFLPLMIALARNINTKLGYAAMSAGIFTILNGFAVGIFPLDRLIPHIVVAMLFFWGWMFTLVLFSSAIYFNRNEKRLRPVMIAGIIALLPAAIFVILPKESAIQAFKHFDSFKRPEFWILPTVEWLVLASMGAWNITVSVLLWKIDKA